MSCVASVPVWVGITNDAATATKWCIRFPPPTLLCNVEVQVAETPSAPRSGHSAKRQTGFNGKRQSRIRTCIGGSCSRGKSALCGDGCQPVGRAPDECVRGYLFVTRDPPIPVEKRPRSPYGTHICRMAQFPRAVGRVAPLVPVAAACGNMLL